MMSEDKASQDQYDDDACRQDVLLDRHHEHASAARYPRMWNMSAGMAFLEAVIRPDVPQRPEFVRIAMPARGSDDLGAHAARIFAVARWNALWEAAQFRRRFFSDDTAPDVDDLMRLPADLARIAELGDNNVVFVPRTRSRYYDYAPLFHLLPLATLDRYGLPLLHGGHWPFWAELNNPDPYLPADFHQRLTKAWGATVWRHLMPSSSVAAFTGDDPIRLLAHNLDFWIPAVSEAMEDEMREWPIVDTGFTSGSVRLNNGEILDRATMGGPRVGSDIWSGEYEAARFVERTVEAADRTGRLRDILDAVRSHRVHDDFSDRWSHAREDFERKLNHTRAKVKVSFVELDDIIPVHGPETEVVGNLACSDFLAVLSPKDREVVIVLRSGVTKLAEVGSILGYSNHSAVSKRLARIRNQAVRFFDGYGD